MGLHFSNTSDQRVSYSVSGAFDISQKTYLAWFYDDDGSEGDLCGTIASSGADNGADNGDFILYNYNNGLVDIGKFTFFSFWTGNNGVWRTTNDVFSVNTRNHLAITYDNSSPSNNPILYAQGNSVSVTTDSAPTGSRQIGTNSVVRIGAVRAGPASPKGFLASFLIYNRILSASEIADAYNSRLLIPTYNGLVFASNLCQPGTTVSDGGTLSGSVFPDFVSGVWGTANGSPTFKQDDFLSMSEQ